MFNHAIGLLVQPRAQWRKVTSLLEVILVGLSWGFLP